MRTTGDVALQACIKIIALGVNLLTHSVVGGHVISTALVDLQSVSSQLVAGDTHACSSVFLFPAYIGQVQPPTLCMQFK